MTSQVSLLFLLATLAACTTPNQGLRLAADHERVPARQDVEAPGRQVVATDYERLKERQDFETQGEQEAYRARQLFQAYYHYQPQLKFNGPIRMSLAQQPPFISYGRDTLRLLDVAPAYLPLFTQGTLYPTVAGLSFHKISGMEELIKATNSATRRRFTFVVFAPHIANPSMYVFEVENASASRATDTKTFMQGAVLTFIRRGWLML